MTVQIIGLLN